MYHFCGVARAFALRTVSRVRRTFAKGTGVLEAKSVGTFNASRQEKHL